MNPQELADMARRFTRLEDSHTSHQSQLANLHTTSVNLSSDVKIMRIELVANTEVTREIKEVLVAAKTGLRMLGAAGRFVKWTAALVATVLGALAAWSQFFHKGP